MTSLACVVNRLFFATATALGMHVASCAQIDDLSKLQPDASTPNTEGGAGGSDKGAGGKTGGNGGSPLLGPDGGCLGDSCGCVTNDDCAQPAPVCDTTVGLCVKCTGTEGCDGLTPVCLEGANPDLNQCVECDDNTDCPMTSPACVGNVCIGCTTDNNFGCGDLQCQAGPTPLENACVGCLTSDQCAGGGVCAMGQCLPCSVENDAGCTAPKKQCTAGLSPIQNRCVECTEHIDCTLPGFLACGGTTCVACSTVNNVGCLGALPVCKAGVTSLDNQCVECTLDTQCADGVCRSDECVPCDDATHAGCNGATPLCKPGAINKDNQCVECRSNTDCNGNPKGSFCEADQCVSCQINTHCPSDAAAKCGDDNQCGQCLADTDCTHIAGKNVCDAGTCVACTIAKEAQACGDKSCNPATKSCTQTTRESRRICDSCVADSECEDGGNVRCVAMQFSGAPNGAFCLRTEAAGCDPPFAVPLSAISLSGAPGALAESYCSVSQAATSCQAVRDYLDGVTCNADLECGDELGGLCKKVGTFNNRCTIPCDSNDGCRSTNICNAPTTPYCH